MPDVDIKALKRQARDQKAHLIKLTDAVKGLIAAFDEQLKQNPPTPAERHEWGRRLARLINELEHANDYARYFGLHVKWPRRKVSDRQKVPRRPA